MGIEGVESTSSTQGAGETGETGETSPANDAKDMVDKEQVTLRDLGEFKEKAPEVYKKMLEAMATEINNRSRRSVENIKRINREGRR